MYTYMWITHGGVCVYVYAGDLCMEVSMCMLVHVYAYLCTCELCIQVYVHMNTCEQYMQVSVFVNVSVHVCVCVCELYIQEYVCVCVFIRVCIGKYAYVCA